MLYNNYYGGMHFFWWIFWIMMLVWIFMTPYSIPGQRWRRYSPLDMLRRRYDAGHLTRQEYDERKDILEADGAI